MFFVSRCLSLTCAFREDSARRRKQLDLGYHSDYQHICKVIGPRGNTACYSKCGKPQVPRSVFLLLFNFSPQQHDDTLVNSLTGRTGGRNTPSLWICPRKKEKLHREHFEINVRQSRPNVRWPQSSKRRLLHTGNASLFTTELDKGFYVWSLFVWCKAFLSLTVEVTCRN